MILFSSFVIGIIVGSFLNVVICRAPEKKSIRGRSCCPACHKKLKPIELVPIFSWLWLKGKCKGCKEKISWQYPIVEFVTGAVFVFLAWHHQIGAGLDNIMFWRDIIFAAVLLLIFVIDLRFYLILDVITIPFIVFAFVINFFIYSTSANYGQVIWNLLLAAAIGGLFFAAQYWLSKGKWIGGGDIRMGILMGMMLGWPKILAAIFFAYIIGAIISIFLLMGKKKKMKSEVPFGIFLSVATFIILVYGNQILDWYLNLLQI